MKTKWNKFLKLGLVFPVSVIGIIASCGNGHSNDGPKKETPESPQNPGSGQTQTISDVSKISNLVASRRAEISAAKADASKHFAMNIAIVTADGTVTDKSFNQSSWEAIQQIAAITGGEITPIDSSTDSLSQKYNSLINTNKNIWVLSGFQHNDALQAWLAIPENKQSFTNKKIIVIGIDLPGLDDVIPQGQYIRLNYKTEEAGYLAGYANAAFLAAKYPNNANKRSAITVGGGAFAAVTDFIAGYLAGIKAYNAANPTKKTKITANTIKLDTNFTVDATSKNTLEGLAANGSPSTLLAVAGPLTGIFADIAAGDHDRFLIGVDTDQSLVYTNAQRRFFTSILKNLGYSLFSVLADLYTKKSSSKYLGGFVQSQKNAFVKLGYKDKFVDIADSSLPDSDKTLADKAIGDAKKHFDEKTKNSNDVRKTLAIPEMDTDQQARINKLVSEINK
ncbi:BMP family ABC transporter substrate-binding protein [Mesomycoplasma ovipneumoniae]|uniref:BMP family ABC transporter substrate-binding protein n=1 Tax=Mesomycoplasma ovipneumoniae TaxID=29562 RepID=UPI0029640401|nr:BMP family ABC transporter substrate-binding protein [Mesomycoplasma ovipneumoniae]MDW2860676.1 BMP family ABC transporter substrate-binding protein [Mesomycoplasma ovipneumoniae]